MKTLHIGYHAVYIFQPLRLHGHTGENVQKTTIASLNLIMYARGLYSTLTVEKCRQNALTDFAFIFRFRQ